MANKIMTLRELRPEDCGLSDETKGRLAVLSGEMAAELRAACKEEDMKAYRDVYCKMEGTATDE